MKITVEQLRAKEVINLRNGARLGFIEDVEFDTESGKVERMVLPGKKALSRLVGKGEDVRLEWNKIRRIGDDIVLVDSEDTGDLAKNDRGWLE